jgi:hypothetical protein
MPAVNDTTIDHLFLRPPADAELKASARDQIGCACVLDHIERVLVTHIDDGRPDLDAARLRAHRLLRQATIFRDFVLLVVAVAGHCYIADGL